MSIMTEGMWCPYFTEGAITGSRQSVTIVPPRSVHVAAAVSVPADFISTSKSKRGSRHGIPCQHVSIGFTWRSATCSPKHHLSTNPTVVFPVSSITFTVICLPSILPEFYCFSCPYALSIPFRVSNCGLQTPRQPCPLQPKVRSSQAPLSCDSCEILADHGLDETASQNTPKPAARTKKAGCD